MQRPELAEAYRNTTFEVDHPDGKFGIRVGKSCAGLDQLLRQHAVTTWAFITAWNPHSRQLSSAENARRHADLVADVRAAGYTFYTGRGRPDRGGWLAEESLLILGISEDEALRLAAKFGQNAIVAGSAGELAQLKWCRQIPPTAQT